MKGIVEYMSVCSGHSQNRGSQRNVHGIEDPAYRQTSAYATLLMTVGKAELNAKDDL